MECGCVAVSRGSCDVRVGLLDTYLNGDNETDVLSAREVGEGHADNLVRVLVEDGTARVPGVDRGVDLDAEQRGVAPFQR